MDDWELLCASPKRTTEEDFVVLGPANSVNLKNVEEVENGVFASEGDVRRMVYVI
jgi:hypothetical protein